jgi:RND family efflux transporter MFP subunit
VQVLKWIIRIVPVIAVLGVLGWIVAVRIGEAMSESEPQRRTVAVAVEVAEPQRGLIRHTRQFTGTLRARSQVDIAPRISGRINRLLVDIGDTVERGQVIARLDDDEHQQEVEQARADLLVAQATLQERQSTAGIAQRDYERVQRLREQRVASESELDAAMSRYESETAAIRVAEAEVTRREAALRAAQVRLSYCTIAADWDTENGGAARRVVGERFVDEGATTAANAPLVSLLDIDHVIAVVYVNERDYASLRRGLTATIDASTSRGGSRTTASGTIVRMAPAFQEGSRQARIEIDVANPEHQLKPGMFVTVSLELGRDENALTIPRQALLLRDGLQGVFVVDTAAGTARFVPVELGISDRTRVQVLEPSIDGPVVVLGQHLLSDGVDVTFEQQDSTAQGDRGP